MSINRTGGLLFDLIPVSVDNGVAIKKYSLAQMGKEEILFHGGSADRIIIEWEALAFN